ncbi:Fe2+ or Zn2+ uptake regulation protein [Clostridium tetanomorphum]|uniref:Transcriptional repressor n=1 Tax=Clostridium tetanomorphum TaxID=1553 RepID=A0A923EC80_CLOTT|nr:Fur family transcriptional regulator [Clostridium tetanomorphum]KAJ51699.1 Fur family transcriptional regulator [Clostridium tetanomorphum DSM 665]MBC2399126.1 transcriptional repressor [Clostridium tetanomorphum]MBP1865936.1 Fe2+ or Zn2+ uptake regulation protein [Clostridium tetanomorphum]NRS86117.1 Fe2+ or Zn2+ uptake regulation protein [Clostridium tetanomorphum]NRZ95862.1 Fe2+ or Zn2+ uptake regulation protein [Clostridium tetanomorphum]
MEKELEFYKRIFQINNIRLTPSRIAILEIFFNNRNVHLTTNEIYYLVKANCPSLGLATVYRTIQILLRLDLLDHLSLDDRISRYKLFLNNRTNIDVHVNHHPHLICFNCKKIIDCDFNLINIIKNVINEKFSFTITNWEMKFYGYCDECYNKKLSSSDTFS